MSTPRYFLVSPRGILITRVLTGCVETASIDEIAADGAISGHSNDDFPDMQQVGWKDTVHVQDRDDGEYRACDCRLVTAPEEFSPWDEGWELPEAWPQEIIDLCGRADSLAYALLKLTDLHNVLPSSYRDATTEAVLRTVVEGRLKDELAHVEAQIKAFRDGRTEPTEIVEAEDADA